MRSTPDDPAGDFTADSATEPATEPAAECRPSRSFGGVSAIGGRPATRGRRVLRSGVAALVTCLGLGGAAWLLLPGDARVTAGERASVREPLAAVSEAGAEALAGAADSGRSAATIPLASQVLGGEAARRVRSAEDGPGDRSVDGLREMLESLAELEGRVLTDGRTPPDSGLLASIEALLRPHLSDDGVGLVVLARLERGDFEPGDALRASAQARGGASLSRAEFGALRFLYWNVALAGSPESDWYRGDLGAARRLLATTLEALARLDPRVGIRWAEHVGDLGERLPGLIDSHLALEWLEAFRTAGGADSVHRALALALGPYLGDTLGTAYLMSLVEELRKPAEVGRALQLLLESGEVRLGLDLALGVLGRPGVTAELRAAVFEAVRRGAPVESAVDFVADHLDLLGRPANPFLGLGYRDDAPEALFERYLSELASGTEPRLRRLLVGGLSKLDGARLEDIARHDSDLEVRAHALLKLLNQDDGEPADLFELAADVVAAPEGSETLGQARFYLRGCLGALLGRGEAESRSTALDYLRQLARTSSSPAARQQFLEVHARHAAAEAHQQFLAELGL
jgi:hypothetical protein